MTPVWEQAWGQWSEVRKLGCLARLSGTDDPAIPARLIELLPREAENTLVFHAILRLLAQVGGREEIAPILLHLRPPFEMATPPFAALRSIARRDPGGVAVLREILFSPGVPLPIRMAAAHTFGSVCERAELPSLLTLFSARTTPPELRGALLHTIARLAARFPEIRRGVVRRLKRICRASERDLPLACEAAGALVECDDPRGTTWLLKRIAALLRKTPKDHLYLRGRFIRALDETLPLDRGQTRRLIRIARNRHLLPEERERIAKVLARNGARPLAVRHLVGGVKHDPEFLPAIALLIGSRRSIDENGVATFTPPRALSTLDRRTRRRLVRSLRHLARFAESERIERRCRALLSLLEDV